MNRRRRIIAVAGALVAVVAALLIAMPGRKEPAGPLTGAAIGGAFAGIDQDGHPITDRMLRGRYVLYYFGYTFCPDVCPLDVANLARGMVQFAGKSPGRAARVRPVFVTVDPARDTPAVLKTWLAAFPARFTGITGTPAQMMAMRTAFRVYAQPQGSGRDYLVDHSAAIYLFGPDGRPISFVERGAAPAAVAAELDRYVR